MAKVTSLVPGLLLHKSAQVDQRMITSRAARDLKTAVDRGRPAPPTYGMRPRPLGLALLVIAAMAVTALGLAAPSAGATGPPGGPRLEDTPSGLAGYRVNHMAAEHEAQHLLSLARLKPGARHLDAPPPCYPKPALPYQAMAGVTIVQLAEYWSAPVGAAPAGASVPWEPPAGLVLNGWGSGSEGDGVSSTNDTYWAKATSQWGSAELEFTEVDDNGTACAVQALAVVTWLDPRPMVDGAPGPRDHVGTAQPCPGSVPGVAGVSNPAAYARVLRGRLLPRALPWPACCACTTWDKGSACTAPCTSAGPSWPFG